MTKKSNLTGSLILCTAALLWGLAFVVQNRAADKIPPFTFNCLRSIIGALFLFGFMAIMSIKNKDYVIIPKAMDKKLHSCRNNIKSPLPQQGTFCFLICRGIPWPP